MHQVETMFYVNEVPWHGLGTELNEPPTVEDAIVAAGLDWRVDLETMKLHDGVIIADRRAVVRQSDRSVLGIVSPSYQPLQNVDAFKFFQPFIDAKECTLETAGSLYEGKKIWVLARIDRDPLKVVGDDTVQMFLLLANGHTGGFATTVAMTPIRTVCANTLALALSHSGTKMMRVIHSQSIIDNLELVRDTIDVVSAEFKATVEQYTELAKRQINGADLDAYVRRVYYPPTMTEAQERSAKKLMGKIVPMFEKGRGNDLPGTKGTWWAAYNAVAEQLSYDRGRSRNNRIDSLWFGAAATTNSKALQLAMEMSE